MVMALHGLLRDHILQMAVLVVMAVLARREVAAALEDTLEQAVPMAILAQVVQVAVVMVAALGAVLVEAVELGF